MAEEPSGFWVTGIVAVRNKQPYLQLSNETGVIAQLTMGQARSIACDILVQASRAEADAMLHRFCAKMDLPEGTGSAMMMEFREFRAELDQEVVERTIDRSET